MVSRRPAFILLFITLSLSAGCSTVSAPEQQSSDKSILKFIFPDIAISAVIDQCERAITFSVPESVNLAALVPEIIISPNAKVQPASGVTNDFSDRTCYTVTAEDGSTVMYSVTAVRDSGSALILVDLQNGVFTVGIHRQEQMLANIGLLLDKAHTADVPVCFIQQTDENYFQEGTYAWYIRDDISRSLRDSVITKHEQNAFLYTTLHDYLREQQVGRVYICGLVSNGCVRETCRGGHRLGYSVLLVEDAHSTTRIHGDEVIDEVNRCLEEEGTVTLVKAEEVDFTS